MTGKKPKIKICSGKEILFREGEKADRIFFIHRGIVEIYKGEVEDSNLRALFICRTEKSSIGAMDFLKKGEYFFTARVKKYAEVEEIARKEFKALIRGNPTLFTKIISGLLEEACSMRSQLEKIIQDQHSSDIQNWDSFRTIIDEEVERANEAEESLESVVEMVSTLAGVKLKFPSKK